MATGTKYASRANTGNGQQKLQSGKDTERKSEINRNVLQERLPDSRAPSPSSDGSKPAQELSDRKDESRLSELPPEVQKMAGVLSASLGIQGDGEICKFYRAVNPQIITNSAMFYASLCDVTLGDNYNQRQARSVKGRSLQLNYVLFMDNNIPDQLAKDGPGNVGVLGTNTQSQLVRVTVICDKMPFVGLPSAYNVVDPPVSSSNVFTGAGLALTTQPAIDGIVQWNPITVPRRYEVLYDEVHDMIEKVGTAMGYPSGGATFAGYTQKFTMHRKSVLIDLKGKVTSWYDPNNAAAQMANKYYVLVNTDNTVNATGSTPRFTMLSEFRYSK